jgi:hypothetical protein
MNFSSIWKHKVRSDFKDKRFNFFPETGGKAILQNSVVGRSVPVWRQQHGNAIINPYYRETWPAHTENKSFLFLQSNPFQNKRFAIIFSPVLMSNFHPFFPGFKWRKAKKSGRKPA